VKRLRVGGSGAKATRLVSSPGFPKSYPADSYCTWRVIGRRKHLLRLSIVELDVEQTPSCLFDFLEIRAGGGERRRKGIGGSGGKLLARYCGTLRQFYPTAAVNISTTGIIIGFHMHRAPSDIVHTGCGK